MAFEMISRRAPSWNSANNVRRDLVLAACLLLAAAGAGPVLESHPLVALAVPGAAAAAFVAARFPELMMLCALAVVGAEGSLQAFLSLNPARIVTVLMAALVLGAAGQTLFGFRREAILLWPGLLLLSAYVALTAFDVLAAESLAQGLRAFRNAAFFMLAGLVLALSLRRQESRLRLIRGIVLLSLLVGLYATYRWVTGPTLEELRVAGRPGSNLKVDGRIPLFGSFSLRGSLGRWAAYAIPFCMACGLVSLRGAWRIAALTACALCAVALFGAEVRIAAVATATGVLAVLAMYQLARSIPGARLGLSLAASVLALVVGGAAWAFTAGRSPDSADRFARVFNPSEDESFGTRTARWPEAIRIVKDQPLGVGLGSAGSLSSESKYILPGAASTDNSYLQVAIEQGVHGLLLFIGAVVTLTIGLARRAMQTDNRELAGPGIGATGALVAQLLLMYTGLSIGGLPVLLLWTLVAVAVAGFVFPRTGGTGTRRDRPQPGIL